MKKTLFLMLAVVTALFTACSSDDSSSVSFERTAYTLTDGSVSVKLIAPAATQATEYPVTFGGTAVLNQDYTVSATKYVIGGTSPVNTIEVTAKNNFDADKTITMTAGGATTTIALGKRDRVLYSFSQKEYALGGEVEVQLDLLKVSDASAYAVPRDMTVSIEPDASSTAVEGTNYTIENKTATILAGQSSCTFKIKTKTYEEGKTQIVLKPVLSEADGYVKGQFPTTTVNMISSYASDLMGEWQVTKLVTDPAYFNETWSGFVTTDDTKNLPTLNTADTYTFTSDANGLVLKTSLQSGFKNYFQSESAFTVDKEGSYHFSGMTATTVQLLKLSNVNRFFSASQTSEDKEAYIGVRNVKDEDTGETYLELYVIDYDPKDFLGSIASFDGMYDKNKPTAAAMGLFFELQLKKKK
jgi:hypothetical protein